MFVSESKFQAHPSAFIPLIKNRDTAGLEALITKPEVERALLARLRKKATLYARELGMDGEPVVVSGPASPGPASPSPDGESKFAKRFAINGNGVNRSENGSENGTGVAGVKRHKFRIDVTDVERLYEDWIIPLTKEVEVSQLLYWVVLDGEIDASLAGPIPPTAPRWTLGRRYRGADEALMFTTLSLLFCIWQAQNRCTWCNWCFGDSVRIVSTCINDFLVFTSHDSVDGKTP
jgi:hypothetical protein